MAVQSSKKPSALPYPSLVPLGHHAGKPAIPLGKAVILVGSRQNAHLHLLSRHVSKAHALILSHEGSVYIRDLASREQVYINGVAEREAWLKEGDLIKIGSFTFKYKDGPKKGTGAAGDPAPDAANLVISGADAPMAVAEKVMLIGRRPTCDISLIEASVSTAHAVIFHVGGKRYIRDLGSRTGTFVNGQKIHQQELAPGDNLRIGETDMHYVPSRDDDHAIAPVGGEHAHDEIDELEDLVGTAPLDVAAEMGHHGGKLSPELEADLAAALGGAKAKPAPKKDDDLIELEIAHEEPAPVRAKVTPPPTPQPRPVPVPELDLLPGGVEDLVELEPIDLSRDPDVSDVPASSADTRAIGLDIEHDHAPPTISPRIVESTADSSLLLDKDLVPETPAADELEVTAAEDVIPLEPEAGQSTTQISPRGGWQGMNREEGEAPIPLDSVGGEEAVVEEVSEAAAPEAIPVVESAVEEVPLEELPLEELPAEEAGAGEAVSEVAPAAPAVEEVPLEEVVEEPVPESPAAEAEIPLEEAPVEEVPVEEVPVEEVPVEEVTAPAVGELPVHEVEIPVQEVTAPVEEVAAPVEEVPAAVEAVVEAPAVEPPAVEAEAPVEEVAVDEAVVEEVPVEEPVAVEHVEPPAVIEAEQAVAPVPVIEEEPVGQEEAGPTIEAVEAEPIVETVEAEVVAEAVEPAPVAEAVASIESHEPEEEAIPVEEVVAEAGPVPAPQEPAVEAVEPEQVEVEAASAPPPVAVEEVVAEAPVIEEPPAATEEVTDAAVEEAPAEEEVPLEEVMPEAVVDAEIPLEEVAVEEEAITEPVEEPVAQEPEIEEDIPLEEVAVEEAGEPVEAVEEPAAEAVPTEVVEEAPPTALAAEQELIVHAQPETVEQIVEAPEAVEPEEQQSDEDIVALAAAEIAAETTPEAPAAPSDVEEAALEPVEEIESLEAIDESPEDTLPEISGEVGQSEPAPEQVSVTAPAPAAPEPEVLEEVEVLEELEPLEELEELPELSAEPEEHVLPVLELDAADLKPVRQRDPESLLPIDQVDPEALDEVELIEATEPTAESALDLESVGHEEPQAEAGDALSDTAFGRQVAEFTSTSTGDIVESIPAVQTRNLVNESTRLARGIADIEKELADALSETPSSSGTQLAAQSPVEPVESQGIEGIGESVLDLVSDKDLTSNLTGDVPELEETHAPASPPPIGAPLGFIGTDLSSFIGGMPLVLPELAPPPSYFGQVQVAFDGSRPSLPEETRRAFPVGKALADEMEQAAAGLRDAEDLAAHEQPVEPPAAPEADATVDEGAPADEWNVEAVLDLEEEVQEEPAEATEPVGEEQPEALAQEQQPEALPEEPAEELEPIDEAELLEELSPEAPAEAQAPELSDTPFGDQESVPQELEVTAQEDVHESPQDEPSVTPGAAPLVDESAVEELDFSTPVDESPAIAPRPGAIEEAVNELHLDEPAADQVVDRTPPPPVSPPTSSRAPRALPPRQAGRSKPAAEPDADAGADVIFGAMGDGRGASAFGGAAPVREVDVFSATAALGPADSSVFGARVSEEIPPSGNGAGNGDAAHGAGEQAVTQRRSGRVIVPPRLGVLGAGAAAVESLETQPVYRTIRRKSATKRLLVALLLMLLLIAGAIAGIFYFWKPHQTSEGVLRFDNVGALTTAQYKQFQRDQHERLFHQNVILGARGILAAQSIPPGFLGEPAAYGRLKENWVEQKRGQMTIRWEDGTDARDNLRVLAVMQALYQENARDVDRARRLKKEVDDLEKRLAEITDLRNQRDQKIKIVSAAPTDSQIAQFEEQVRQADAEFTRAHAAAQTARLDLKRAEQQMPSPGEALLNKEDKTVDPELAQLQKTLEETAGRLAAAKSAVSEEADQKRKSLDQAIEQFQQTAAALSKENPQLANYVAAVQQLQEKTHKLSGDLIEVQQQHHGRLSDLKKKVDDLAQARREKAWAQDKELADLRSRLDLAQRGYNALVGENFTMESNEVKAALTDIRDLTGKIEARKAALGDVAFDEVASHLVEMIKIAKERLEADRARIEKDIKDQEQAFAASGMIEKLPETQKVQAASLKARQEAINDLRKQYADALEKRSAESNAALRETEGQIASLNARIDERRRAIAAAGAAKLTAEQEAARKADLEAKQNALKQADEKLAETQKAYAARDRALRDALARRDEVITARRELEAINQTLGQDGGKEDAEQKQRDLEMRRDELKKVVIAQAPAEDDVRVTGTRDDRMLFSTIAVVGIAVFFGILSVFLVRGAHHTIEQVIDPTEPPIARRAGIESIETTRPAREPSVL